MSGFLEAGRELHRHLILFGFKNWPWSRRPPRTCHRVKLPGCCWLNRHSRRQAPTQLPLYRLLTRWRISLSCGAGCWRACQMCKPALLFLTEKGHCVPCKKKRFSSCRGKSLQARCPPLRTAACISFVHSLFSTAEHWLGAHAAAHPTDRLVLAESHGDSLDTTLLATGGVNCGFENPSQLRPALQALGLALEMCWAPLDVGRLVDFLTHPVGPFSRKARATLAKAVAEQPGIGGAAWVEAKNKIAADKDDAALVVDIEFWLESERWPRHQGAPLDALLARAYRLKEAMRRRLSGDPSIAATFAPAHRQCAAVFDSLCELSRQGVATLMPRQIEQLVAHATPKGASNPGAVFTGWLPALCEQCGSLHRTG